VYQGGPVQLQIDPIGGFAPLKVSFKVKAAVPGELKQVLYDFDGDHVADKISHDFQPVSYTYAEPGERFPVVTVETTAGRFSSMGLGWFSPPTCVNVQAPPVLMSVIKIPDPVDIKFTATINLYVLSGSTASLTEFNANGKIIRSLDKIGLKPSGLEVDAVGNVYVAISGANQVWKFKPAMNSFEPDSTFGNGGFIGNKDGSAGSNFNQFNMPFDVGVTRSFRGEQITVSDSGNHRIQQFSSNGAFINSFGQHGTNMLQFNSLKGLAYDGVGYLFIVDSGNNRVVVAHEFGSVATSGEAGTALGQFREAVNLCAGARGICVADAGNNRVQIFDPARGGEGASLTPFNPRVAISSELGLKEPNAVAWMDDSLEEKIYIADTGNNRVILVKLPLDNPEAVWNDMKARLAAADVPGAISHFSTLSKDKYQEAFLSMSKNELLSVVKGLGPIKPAVIENESAQYYFTNVVDGQVITFPIEFVKENGIWKIMEY
ncbi:MAG: NHL repeat-containing protein, partial [Verrucomicrobiota bacterium]